MLSQAKAFVSALVLSLVMGIGSSAYGILVTKDFETAPNVVGSVNLGGLDFAGNDDANTPNGSEFLSFLLTVDDSSGTGAVFNAVLTLAGTTSIGGNSVRSNAIGKIPFAGGDDFQDTLTLTVDSIIQTSGPSATAVFDGFTQAHFDQFNGSNDEITIAGYTFSGPQTSEFDTVFTPILAPSGSTFDRTGAGQIRLETLTSQFTVTAVPEASQVVTFGLLTCGLGLVHWKRRRSASKAAA